MCVRHIYLAAVCLLCGLKLNAQGGEAVFGQPFRFAPVFAGNFGELRSDHFHGGLDFKTQGAENRPVYAQADGHVSRIRVNSGSGYVLNVAYDNGYHLIYRHLNGFTPDIDRRVKALQYSTESWEVDIRPEAGEYPVKKGQLIARSGNTGYSFGPHLHLDVVDAATGEFVDPLPFFTDGVKDRTPPKAHGFLVIPQEGGTVDGQSQTKEYAAAPAAPIAITAWGTVGVALKAYDYTDVAPNKLGVKTVSLSVDGREVFRSHIDRLDESEHKYIRAWTVGQYMKMFVEPGNKLSVLHAGGADKGLITIDEERPYHLLFTMTDGMGNTSVARLTLTGKRQEPAGEETPAGRVMEWNKRHVLQQPGLAVIVPQGRLYADVRLNMLTSFGGRGAVSHTYRLTDEPVSLLQPAEVEIRLQNRPVADMTKYYVAMVGQDGRRRFVGGQYHVGGYMRASTSALGTFTVEVDTVAPRLTAVQSQSWGKTGRVALRATDDQSGVKTFQGRIDGQWALFGRYNSTKAEWVCYLDPEHVKRGGTHRLECTVTDACGNRRTETFTFAW